MDDPVELLEATGSVPALSALPQGENGTVLRGRKYCKNVHGRPGKRSNPGAGLASVGSPL
jgi:hypothetical protein